MLNKDEILNLTGNGLNIFKHYIPGSWRVGRNFLNPLYDDRKASCNIYFDRMKGCYCLKDFGNDAYSGDCFAFVGQLKGLHCNNANDFVEILKLINRDLSLGLDENGSDSSFVLSVSQKPVRTPKQQPETPKKIKPYSIVQQSFSARETAFWQQYGITVEILKIYKVLSLREFKSENNEGKPFCFTSTDAEPVFAYAGKRHVKIYRPFSDVRFLYGGNLPENHCFGLEQLPSKGDTLFITGGEKDVMSLAARGFHAVCFNSETSNIPQNLIKKQTCRFKHIILLYDTEQSEVQLYKNISGILKRGKSETMPTCFKAYCLTSMSRKERMQAIVQSMDKFYYQYNGIHLVVVDGIADLVRCANDEAESVAVIDELYRLAGIYKTCIVCVLHFVPNGMKLRGHLGSELQRKAAAILSIERDEEPQISVVKALKVRDGSPLDVPLVQFAWDREKAMHAYVGEKPKEEKEKRKETELTNVARTVFSNVKHCTYVDLCEQIKAILDVRERAAKNYIKFMRDRGIIVKDPSNISYFIIGNI